MQFSQIIPFTLLLVLVACASPQAETTKESVTKEAVIETPTEPLVSDAEVEEVQVPEQSPEEEEESIEEINRQIEQNIQKVLGMEKPSIVDYFMALPHYWAHVDCDESRGLERRKKAITYQNIGAGYLKSDLWQAEHLVVMYKDKANGITYIGQLGDDQCGDYFCGAEMEGFATLSKEGEWIKANEQLLEWDSLTNAVWDNRGRGYSVLLPEKGTSIKITRCFTDNPMALGEFKWLGDRFQVALNAEGKEFFAQIK
ncbi:MAG: hypothetical protein AAF927_27970 [Bacteroidota bacterium]